MKPNPQENESAFPRHGFTLIELLVIIAMVGLLAGLLLPTLAKAKGSALKSNCTSNLRQLGMAWRLYLDDHNDVFPDRRDLKASLPGGYMPWSTWPKSDPRAGWAAFVLKQEIEDRRLWSCPALAVGPLKDAAQAAQWSGLDTNSSARVTYWMWRFDRVDSVVPLDNFWGRTVAGAVTSLREANSPTAGTASGPSQVELMVDPYFPNTIPALPSAIRGWSAHLGGRNRLMLDGHVEHFRDARTR